MKISSNSKAELRHPYSEMARLYEKQNRKGASHHADYFADHSHPNRPAQTLVIS